VEPPAWHGDKRAARRTLLSGPDPLLVPETPGIGHATAQDREDWGAFLWG